MDFNFKLYTNGLQAIPCILGWEIKPGSEEKFLSYHSYFYETAAIS